MSVSLVRRKPVLGVASAASAADLRKRDWSRRLPLLPALLIVIALTQLPFVMTIYYSLQRWNLLSVRPARFVGLRNFFFAFSDSTFLQAVKNTLVMTTSIVVVSLVFGTLLATGLNRKF